MARDFKVYYDLMSKALEEKIDFIILDLEKTYNDNAHKTYYQQIAAHGSQ